MRKPTAPRRWTALVNKPTHVRHRRDGTFAACGGRPSGCDSSTSNITHCTMLPATPHAKVCEYVRALSTCVSATRLGKPSPSSGPGARSATTVLLGHCAAARLVALDAPLRGAGGTASLQHLVLASPFSPPDGIGDPPEENETPAASVRNNMPNSAGIESFPRPGRRAVGAMSGGDAPYLSPADPA